ncbi:MAG: hypothetical protein R3A52_24450 [Polyangiales bacterium]
MSEQTTTGLFQEIADALDSAELRPDPTRADWAEQRARLLDLWRRAEHELVPGVRAAYRENAASAIPPGDLAGLMLEFAALYAAAGMAEQARASLGHALSLAPEDHPLQTFLRAAKTDPEGVYAILLTHWDLRHHDFDALDRDARRALKGPRSAETRALLQKALDGPRPVKSAPSLFTMNGVGTMLYGSRDARDDGSYIATRFFTLLFVPLIPIDAWRVRDAGHQRYYFLAREPLSRLTRNYRRLVAGAALALGLAAPAQSWYASPARHAASAFTAAQSYARSHTPDEALRRYESVARTYGSTAPAEAGLAAEAALRILAARVHSPATTAQRGAMFDLVRLYDAVPAEARTDAVRRVTTDALARWQSELGDGSVDALELRASLLHTLRRVTALSDDHGRWVAAAVEVERAITTRISDDWPLDALERAGRVFDGVYAVTPEGAARWVEAALINSSTTRYAAESLRAWDSRAGLTLFGPLKARVVEALQRADAREADAARAEALRTGDREQLAAQRAADPGDQEVALALAVRDYAAGDTAARRAALASLESLCHFALAPPEVQSARAEMMFALGRGEEADALVDALATLRLPAMRALSNEAQARRRDLVQRYVDQAQRGTLPAEIAERLRGASDDQQREAFGEWVRARLGEDGELRSLDARRVRYAPVVTAVLARGRWLVARANEQSGEARQQTLERARAAMLSVASESQGSMEYRLAMGQAEHQLGREREGEALLAQALAEGGPREHVAVAAVYRQLGLLSRAREISDRAWEASTDADEKRAIAAFRMTFPSSIEDEERWLSRADDGTSALRRRRKEVEAHRALREDRLAEADRLLSEARGLYSADELLTPAGANNAALLELERFECTGDVARVEAARQGIESALRRAPESATVISNLIHPTVTLAYARALEGDLRLRALRPNTNELTALFFASRAAHGGDRVTELSASPLIRRARELTQQLETLSPSSGETWAASQGLARTTEEQSALDAVAQRMARVAHVDVEDADRARALSETPAQREEARRSAEARRRAADRVVDAAQATGHAPTLAAAYAIRAWRRAALLRANDGLTDAAGVVDDLRAALRAWPSLELRGELSEALLRAALSEALPADDARREAFAREQRDLGSSSRWPRSCARPAATSCATCCAGGPRSPRPRGSCRATTSAARATRRPSTSGSPSTRSASRRWRPPRPTAPGSPPRCASRARRTRTTARPRRAR